MAKKPAKQNTPVVKITASQYAEGRVKRLSSYIERIHGSELKTLQEWSEVFRKNNWT